MKVNTMQNFTLNLFPVMLMQRCKCKKGAKLLQKPLRKISKGLKVLKGSQRELLTNTYLEERNEN